MRTSGRNAFTMIELVLVIVIMAVLLGMILPNLKGPGGREALNSSTREFAAMCSLARQQAISLEGPVRIRIDAENKRWRLVLPAKDERASRRNDLPASTVERHRELARGVRISALERGGNALELKPMGGTYPEVTFFPNGASSGIGVELEGSGGKKMSIVVAQATGRVRTWRGGLDREEAAPGAESGDGHAVIAQTEEERLEGYKKVVGRLVADQRRQFEMNQGGLSEAEYYAMKEEERLSATTP